MGYIATLAILYVPMALDRKVQVHTWCSVESSTSRSFGNMAWLIDNMYIYLLKKETHQLIPNYHKVSDIRRILASNKHVDF